MSKFKDMIIDIEADLERGKLSFQQIADFYGIPVGDVEVIAKEVMNQFEAISDAREKNKFFMANRKVIEGVAMSNLKRRSR